MKAHTIETLYTDYTRNFLKHVKKAKGMKEKSIHKMRVSVKHLRAMLSLLEVVCEKKFDKDKLYAFFSPLFKEAGNMRTLSINRALMKVQRSAEAKAFLKAIDKEEQKQAQKLKKEIGRFDKHKFVRHNEKAVKLFRSFTAEEMVKGFLRFLDKQLTEIKQLSMILIEDDCLHEVRKTLKKIKTTTSILNEVLPNPKLKKLLGKVKKLEEKIGDWHDRRVLVLALEKYILKHPSPKGQLVALAIRFKIQNETAKAAIAKELKRFV